ncbi:MAG: sigma 54-interacting transcriptional regulator [Nitrospina sp.]|nr:sigma 54-interacting transcriptional regulator [Nitrospina sp.]
MKPHTPPQLTDDNLDAVLDLLNEAVFVYNQEMQITHFNLAAEQTTGFNRTEVLGEKCVVIFDKSLCINNCELCMTVRDGKNGQVEFRSPFMQKNGSRRLGEFRAGHLSLSLKNQTHVLVSLTDVTEIDRLRNELKTHHSFQKLVGKSPVMQDLFQSIRNVAEYDSTVCVLGESGTGKELVARAIHYESARADRPLVKVNCSALSDNLLESELFGHVKGAFTGALRDRVGKVEEAEGGTLFLDEIGDLTERVQVKLLRVLQEKEIERVGENTTRRVNLRVIVATHKNLEEEVKAGRFRQDLFYRLNVIPVYLPPLRERKEDIPLLVEHFIEKWNQLQTKKLKGVSGSTLGLLLDHNWPGNIRELENTIEHACVKTAHDHLQPTDLPLHLRTTPGANGGIKKPRRRLTKKQIQEALKECGHNQTRTAEHLGVHRITLWRKIRELQIPV